MKQLLITRPPLGPDGPSVIDRILAQPGQIVRARDDIISLICQTGMATIQCPITCQIVEFTVKPYDAVIPGQVFAEVEDAI